MATQVHIEHIDDTESNLRTNLDLSQIGIFTDQAEEFVWMNDDASKLKYGAIQKHWNGGSFVYEDNDFGEVTLHDDLLISEYAKRSGGTDDYIRWQNDDISIAAGGVTVVNFQDDRAWFSLPTGFGTASPAAALHVNGGDAIITDSAGDPALFIGDAFTAGNYGQVQWDSGSDYIALGTNTGGNTLQVYEAGTVTIGSIVSPDGTLHVHTDTAGSVTAHAGADDLVVEHSNNGGISILVPDDAVSRLAFGSPSDSIGCSIAFDHDDGLMEIGTALAGGQVRIEVADNVEAARFDASGNMGINVIPESWANSFRAIQIKGVASFSADAGNAYVSRNAYWDSSDNRWEFINNGDASQVNTASGATIIRGTLVSGSADDPIAYIDLITAAHSTGEVIINDGGEDIDFRVEGKDSSSLFHVIAQTESEEVRSGAVAAYQTVTGGGLTYWVGAGAGLVTGSVYGNEIAFSQGSATQNQWYDISDSDMTSGYLNQITHDGNGQLTVLLEGVYEFVWTGSFGVDTANKHVQIGVAVNGTEVPQGQNDFNSSAVQTELPSSGTGHLDLEANDTVEISMRTTDTGTPTLTCAHLSYKLTMVAGT